MYKYSREEKFWAEVDKTGPLAPYMTEPTPCWIWMGETQFLTGRPCLSDSPRSKLARNVAYKLHNKTEIPKGFRLLARCRTRKCVNPEHMKLVERKRFREPASPAAAICWGEE